jgi:hypothetical protein
MHYKDREIMNFNDLQTRIGRRRGLADVPVLVVAYDLLRMGRKRHQRLGIYQAQEIGGVGGSGEGWCSLWKHSVGGAIPQQGGMTASNISSLVQMLVPVPVSRRSI